MKKTVRDGFNTMSQASQPVEKGSGKGLLVCVTLVLLFIIILLVCIRMDVGGFGSKVLRPVLKDVPVLKHVLPEATDEEVAAETGYRSLAQAVTKIEQLEREIAELKEQQAGQAASGSGEADATLALQAEIDSLKQQIETLKVYESNQKNFEATKEKFYQEVVYNDHVDVSDYTKWYEEMDKDTAAKLYKEAVKTQEASEYEREMAKTYAEMKPAKAAAILNTMTGDVDTVVNILNAMDARDRGAIMGEMNATFAAKITKKMSS